MAKPADITPAQETALRDRLGLAPDADLTSIYDKMSEDGIRKYSGMTTPAITKPTVIIPTAIPRPTPAPTPKVTETDARRASTFRSGIQPESGMLPRFPPTAATSGQEQLDKALEQRRRDIAARSFTGPAETRLSPEQGARLIERGQEIAATPRTPAGETRPLSPTPFTYRDFFGDNVVADFFEAVAPKVIETAAQKKARDTEAYGATQTFFKSFNAGKPPTAEEFKKVYDSYRFYGGKDPDGFMASIMKRSGADKAARAAFTSVSPTGQVIESPLTTAGKVLSASEAGAVTLAAGLGQKIGKEYLKATGEPPANFTPEMKAEYEAEVNKPISLRKEFKKQVSKGTGLMGAGAESFSKAGELFGADKETQDLLSYAGGTLGFIGGIGIPLDLGVIQGAATATRTAATAIDIAGEFGTSAARAAGRGAIGGGLEGVVDAWRITGQRTGGLKTVTKEMETATRNWLNSPSVSNATSTTIKLAADDGVQAAVKADKEAGKVAADTKGAYDQQPYLDALRQRFDDIKAAEVAAAKNHPITQYADFNEWVANAERHGIDVYNSAGKRTKVLGDPPPNVRLQEVEDSIRKTREGKSSVDYFDEVATGGRSSLYYDAFIDSLNPTLKKDLLVGGSVKSSEFLPALDAYIATIRRDGMKAGKTAAQIDTLITDVENALRARGIKITSDRIRGAVKDAPNPTGLIFAPPPQNRIVEGGLILTPSIELALEKAYAIDLGRRTLNDFAGRTGITGQTVRVGNVVLSPAEAEQVRKAVKDNPTLKALRERLNKNNGDPIEVTEAELDALKEYFINPFTKEKALDLQKSQVPVSVGATFIKPTELYSPFQAAPAIARIEASKGFYLSKPYLISAEQYNSLIKAAIGIEASPKITAKSIQDVGRIGAKLGEAPDKASELSYFVRNVMTPKDLQESGLAAILIDKSKKLLNPAPTKNPVANNIITEVNARFGALGERFKGKMRRKMNVDKVSRPQAFADTMVEEFTTEGIYKPQLVTDITDTASTVQKPFSAAPAGAPLFPTEAAFKTKMGAYEMYRSYVASIYGGYEQAIDAVATTGRTLELDKMAIATNEMRDLVTVLMHAEGTIFHERLLLFIDKVNKGENVAALNILQRLHIELSGYSIQQALTRLSRVTEDAIPKLLKEATEDANKGALEYLVIQGKSSRGTKYEVITNGNYTGNNIGFLSGKSKRGADEAYKAASQQAPLFKPENFKEMLVGNYYLRAQANVVDDVLYKAQVDYPELFPNSSLLLQVAQDDFSVVRSGLIKGLDDLDAAGSLTAIESAAYQKLRLGLLMTSDRRIPLFSTPTLTNTGTAKLSQDLLIAGIEDGVSAISGGKVTSKRYLDAISEHFQKLEYAGVALTKEEKTAVGKLFEKGLDELDSKPASIYTKIFDSQSRADATTLFYQTSLTNVKNQLKNPFSASVQGVAEKVGTIPLLQQAQAGLKRPLFNATNIKRTTETIQALQLSSAASKLDQYAARDITLPGEAGPITFTGKNLSDGIAEAEDALRKIIDKELSPEAILLAQRKEAVLNDLGKQTGDVLGRRVIMDTIGTLYDGTSNIAKNGLLGGLLLPNFNYAVVNALTGSLIIAQTVGMRNAASALRIPNPLRLVKGEFAAGLSPIDLDVLDVMKYAYSGPAVVSGRLGWKAPANRVILTTPDGTIYTTEMLAKLVNEGALGKSQNIAEISNSLLGSSLDWAGKTGLYGDKNSVIKAARRNFLNYQDLNVWSTAANAVDQTYRMGVLAKALKEGEPLENATTLARESLFDYGNLTDIEESIAKVVWFYRFKRNNFRSVFTSLATDPKALKAAFAQGQGWEYVYNFGEKTLGMDKNDVDMRYAMKDYSENRIFIDLVEDPENKKRYGIYGPPVPAIQAVAEMTDYASILLTPYVMAAANDKGLVGATAQAGYGAFGVAVENANPMLQTAVLAATGMDIRRGGQTASDYLDPKLVWYMQQNPEQWYTFTTLFNIEEVPFEEERPAVGYYNGRQWRIKKNDRTAAKNWQVWQSGLLMIGVGRTIKDYAPILAQTGPVGKVAASGIVAPVTTLQKPKLPRAPEGKVSLPVTLDVDGWGVEFWRAAGVIQVQDAPLLEEVQKANRLKAAGDIRYKPVQTQQETQ